MQKIGIYWLVISCVVNGFSAVCQELGEVSIEDVNKKIESIGRQKLAAEAERSRHLQKAQRWQFDPSRFAEARQEFELAEQMEQKIFLLENQREALEQKKQEISKEVLP